MHKLLVSSLILVLLASPLVNAQEKKAPTGGPCGAVEANWDCPGFLELRDEKEGKAARLVWFESGELLGERQTGADKQRYLVLLPSRRIFYSNVPTLALGNNPFNPFYRYDRVFADALSALKSGHGKGPASVPIGETRTEIQQAGAPTRLTTWRTAGEGAITFELHPESGPDVRGVWDPRRPAAWPDETSLAGWLDPRGRGAPDSVGGGRKPEASEAPVSPSSAAQR